VSTELRCAGHVRRPPRPAVEARFRNGRVGRAVYNPKHTAGDPGGTSPGCLGLFRTDSPSQPCGVGGAFGVRNGELPLSGLSPKTCVSCRPTNLKGGRSWLGLFCA
jgi:hypothetical protein